jgi:hypothetical protein
MSEIESLRRFHRFKGLVVCPKQISSRLMCKQKMDRIALELLRCIENCCDIYLGDYSRDITGEIQTQCSLGML